MIEPIKPSEVYKSVPEQVIKATNSLITEYWTGSQSMIPVKILKAKIAELMSIEIHNIQLIWLDIEPVYQKVGWDVRLCSPSYDENFDSYFLFLKRKNNG